MFSFEGVNLQIVGVDGGEGTPVPIPNTEVKLTCADNTWLATAREDKKMPTQNKTPSDISEGVFVFLKSTQSNPRLPSRPPCVKGAGSAHAETGGLFVAVRNIRDNPSVFLLRKNPPPFTQGRLFLLLRIAHNLTATPLASPLGERWHAKRDGEGCSYSSPLAMNDIPPVVGAIYCSRNANYLPAANTIYRSAV